MATDSSPAPIPDYSRLVRAHAIAALAMVAYVALLGLAVSTKFHEPDLMSKSGWVTWGRLRYAHTQGVFFGWLGNAFLAFLYYAVPRLAERPLASFKLGWALFFIWNFMLVIPGWALVQMGISQPLEWGEFPWMIDVVVVVALLLACVQFVGPLLRTRLSHLYVSGWYVLGGLVFTLLAYPVGNFVPLFEPGAKGAAYSGLWIHDAIGLFVTPLAVAIAYVVIPAATRRPIFSHFLSMIGFWLLFLVYPFNGTHHFVFSSIPMDAQKGAIVASVYLGVDVILVVTNLLLSLRGSAGTVASNVPLRFVWSGVLWYLVVSMQGSLQALMPVNSFVHFTDWVIGHAHLALIGFASFIAIGGLLHIWERTASFRYNARAAEWCFWLLTIGMLVMVADLTVAGLVQGHTWQSDAPWLDSVRVSKPYWMVRTFSGVVILAGLIALAVALTTGRRAEEAPITEVEETPAAPEVTDVGRFGWLTNAYLVTAVAGLGFFLASFLLLAVEPGTTLDSEVKAKPWQAQPLTARELRGRAIYAREGCVNCHSQLVRSTVADVRRFGVPSQAWETMEQYPHMWGTRRIGPDLARETTRKSRDWHLAHLWNPRHIVPDSNMPAYPWLFAGSPLQPTAEALDLVAYLESLGGDARRYGLTGIQPLPGMDPEEEKRRGMFCDCAIPRTIGSTIQFSTPMDASERARFERRGAEIFARNCAGCHGDKGTGDGLGAQALLPAPRDLTSARFSDPVLARVLWNGVPGSSMPGWHDLPVNDLRSLAVYVQSLEQKSEADKPLTEQQVAEARKLYAANCQNCHGYDQGDLPPPTSVIPVATNFRLVRPTLAHAKKVIAEGVPGTAMTPWKVEADDKAKPSERKDKLSEADRDLLARYVRTLFQNE